MSRIHKVIVLNTPFKLWDFTVRQLIMLVVAVAISVTILSKVPQNWKVFNGLPANIMGAIFFFCLCLPAVKFTDLKPMRWWRNAIAYKLHLEATTFIPHPDDPPPIYPDPSIVEAKKRDDDFYISS